MTAKIKILGAVMAAALLVPGMAMAEHEAGHAPEAAAQTTTEAMEDMKDEGPGRRPNFEEADTNKDGNLSLDEFLERHKKKFAEIDANSDGNISKEELKTYGEARHEKMKERRHEKMHDKDAPPAKPDDTKAE